MRIAISKQKIPNTASNVAYKMGFALSGAFPHTQASAIKRDSIRMETRNN